MHFSLKPSEISRIQENPDIARSSFLTIKHLQESSTKFTVVVSRKHGKAVSRNRIKRVIRELIRKEVDVIKKGYYIIYFNGDCERVTTKDMKYAFKSAIDMFYDSDKL